MKVVKGAVFMYAASGVLGMDNDQQSRANAVRHRLSEKVGNTVTSTNGGRRLSYTAPLALTASQDHFPRRLSSQEDLYGICSPGYGALPFQGISSGGKRLVCMWSRAHGSYQWHAASAPQIPEPVVVKRHYQIFQEALKRLPCSSVVVTQTTPTETKSWKLREGMFGYKVQTDEGFNVTLRESDGAMQLQLPGIFLGKYAGFAEDKISLYPASGTWKGFDGKWKGFKELDKRKMVEGRWTWEEELPETQFSIVCTPRTVEAPRE